MCSTTCHRQTTSNDAAGSSTSSAHPTSTSAPERRLASSAVLGSGSMPSGAKHCEYVLDIARAELDFARASRRLVLDGDDASVVRQRAHRERVARAEQPRQPVRQ